MFQLHVTTLLIKLILHLLGQIFHLFYKVTKSIVFCKLMKCFTYTDELKNYTTRAPEYDTTLNYAPKALFNN